MDVLRTGRISSLNVQKGYARVTYQDRDNMVTSEMPLLQFGHIYWLPRVGDPVMVVHSDNGGEMGVILGRYWCNENVPPEPKEEFFRQEFERGGKSFLRHSETSVGGSVASAVASDSSVASVSASATSSTSWASVSSGASAARFAL